MAAIRPKYGVNTPVLLLRISTVVLYVILLNRLHTVDAVIEKITCKGTTDSVICTLEQNYNESITYNISLTSNNVCNNSVEHRAEIKNLSAGTHYTGNIVITYPPHLANTSRVFTAWTKPEKPGCVTSIQKTNSGLYNITFQAPRGNVSKYKFMIDNLNGYKGIMTNEPTVSNIRLKPGTEYNFSITSYNGNNDLSEVTKCTNRTPSEKASEVRNISITFEQCKSFINWTKPERPNGNITQYQLSTRGADGECKWNCTLAGTCVKSADTDRDSCSTAELRKRDDRMSVWFPTLNLTKTYNVSIAAYNEAGMGSVATQPVTTQIATTTASNVSLSSFRYVTSTNASSGKIKLKIRWEPGTSNGGISYNIEVKKATGHQSQDFDTVKCFKDIKDTEFELDDVLAYWDYQARVQTVICNQNSSWVSSTNHKTAENNPGQVQNLNVVQDATYASVVSVTFDCLNESLHNGILSKYIIRSTFLKENGDEVDDGGPHEYSPNSCSQPISVTISEVEKTHMFTVKAVNQNYSGDYSEAKSLTPTARKPNLSERYPIIADVIEASSEGPDIRVKVCVSCLTNSSQGNVENSGLTVCVLGDDKNNCGSKDVNYHKFLTWKQAQKIGFKEPYRTTPNHWKDNLTSQLVNGTYGVGVEDCDSRPEDEYCNGPLPEGKHVIISVLVCTKAGCEQIHPDAILVNKRPEKPRDYTVSITLGVLASLVIIIVITVLIRRRFLKRNIYEPGTPERKPVKMCDFEQYVKRLHKDSNLLMQSEFEDLKTICMTFKNSCNEAQREANRVKNRFVDILPYDHSRVKLSMQPEEEETNDFINANYIPGFNSVREYIATQGTMPSTIPDFWRMIWEQKSPIIVMVSDLQENGRLKVDQYWPDTLHEPLTFGNVTVEMTNTSQLNKYIIRNFKISKGTETHKVTQFFLPGWYDFSANLSCGDVLEFARMMRQEVTPDTPGPITVHCSAGVGRTGTFIALDYFIQYVDNHSLEDEIDVYGYVLKMRRNRPRMVQAEIQYVFIYDAVLELIKQKIERENKRHRYEEFHNEVEPDGNITLADEKKTENIHIDIQLKDEKCSYVNEAFASENSALNRTISEDNNHKL